MPKRTNPFQKVVAYIYQQIESAGGTVTESVEVPEADGTPREIDILIQRTQKDRTIKIAVECRKHSKKQTVEWIDSLIGKYSGLDMDQIVAVSDTPFTKAAKNKAAAHNIELITVNEALSEDWRKRLEKWRAMTNSFTLMKLTTLDEKGNEITRTDINADGKVVKHRDQQSEHLYNAIYPAFQAKIAPQIGNFLNAKIAENWQSYFDDPTPRWMEFIQPNPGITQHGADIGIRSLVFGVGTFFHVGQVDKIVALKEHALTEIPVVTFKETWKFKMVSNSAGTFYNFVFEK